MASRWQEGCKGWCQDCVNACNHFPGIAHEETYKRFMTIGSMQYGFRVGAVSPPPPGAGPRYRSQCCWPAAPHRDDPTRIPLLPASSTSPINSLDIISCANRTEDGVATIPDQTSFTSVRDYVSFPGGCLLNKRCALVRPQVYGDATDVTKEESATLDRLPRFRFGGNRTEKRGSDKFRELTERLKRSTAPIPPPRRHTRTTPPPAGPDTTTIRAAPLPLRSASFSQVDYCSDDNKYIRRTQDPVETHTSTNTLPRPKNLLRPRQDGFPSTPPEPVVENPSPEPPKEIPEVQVTPEPQEKTLVRAQDTANNNKDKRKDKLRRRKGIYLSQWPTEYYPNDVDETLSKYEEEDLACTCEETAKIIQESLSEITKIHDEKLNKDVSQIIGSSPQEEPLSPEDSSISLEWPSPSPPSNNKIPSLSPDLKDSLKVTSRGNSIFRSDSLSEGEPDNSERKSDHISLIASDVSDCESRLSLSNDNSSPSIPRRYSKRPLRGPYGQMLEAEMKKPDSRKNLRTELKFLDDLANASLTKPKQTRLGGSCNSSIDETFLKDSGLSSPKLPANKRKVSADNLVVETVEQKLVPNHQRTTSSPSKLEGLINREVSAKLLEQLLRGSSEQLATKESSQQTLHNDTRTHVLIEIYDNERIYVESLEIIVKNYWEPLKQTENTLIEQTLVDEIFCEIPFLLNHHKHFLVKLRTRLEEWDTVRTIGDIFLDMLAVPDVIEHYVNYVNSWKRSREIIKSAQSSRPPFAKFLEGAKNNSRKLALDSLLIKPIQKFPKYELLLQRLIKHTTEDNPDYELLIKAEKELHDQLLKINCTEKEGLEIEQLREIESVIEGALELVSPERQYIRHDMIIMSHGGGSKKERALFLFTDLLLITGIKRRSGTITKKGIQNSGSTASNLDGYKYKLIMKVPLEDVEIVRSKDENLRQLQIEVDNLTEDITVLNQISDLSLNLHFKNSALDDLIKEMWTNLSKNLQFHQTNDLQLCALDLSVITQNGLEMVSIVFPKSDIRSSWEETLLDLKSKMGERRSTPDMIATVPIRKTRAGLQFTCAAPTLSDNGRDVWVCNSDGYVGQVCVLTLNEKPEPTVTSCNSVCNTRILCIAAIPGPGIQSRPSSFTSGKNKDKLQPQKAMQFDSSSSSEDDDGGDNDDKKGDHRDSESSAHSDEPDKFATMWLGTEDGCILIYNSNDNIRIKKNKMKMQLGSAVLCIMYLEHRVFVSQANGFILMYERDGKGGWYTNNPKQIIVANSSCPVSKMVVCNSKILCASGNSIFILNPQSFEKETSFVVSNNDPSKSPQNPPISCMFVNGNAVWLSLQNSAIIKCYNAVTFEMVCETSVAPAVQKMLTSCDDIIRQHKAACLRVTALVHCKDLLWIGTSAGVLLTMPLPHVTPNTGKLITTPPVTGVPHGHTGHVRILTSIEMPYPLPKKNTPKKGFKGKCPPVKTTKFLVISGGDGYEDFRTSNLSEVAGREDSTNHLLLWNI